MAGLAVLLEQGQHVLIEGRRSAQAHRQKKKQPHSDSLRCFDIGFGEVVADPQERKSFDIGDGV